MKDHVATCQGTLSANSKPVYLLTSSVTLKVGSVIDLPYKVFRVNSQHGVKQQKFVVPKPDLVTEILKPVFTAVKSWRENFDRERQVRRVYDF